MQPFFVSRRYYGKMISRVASVHERNSQFTEYDDPFIVVGSAIL